MQSGKRSGHRAWAGAHHRGDVECKAQDSKGLWKVSSCLAPQPCQFWNSGIAWQATRSPQTPSSEYTGCPGVHHHIFHKVSKVQRDRDPPLEGPDLEVQQGQLMILNGRQAGSHALPDDDDCKHGYHPQASEAYSLQAAHPGAPWPSALFLGCDECVILCAAEQCGLQHAGYHL